MGGMKRLLEQEMDKRRDRNFKRAGIEETYGEKYKTLFDRGREIINHVPTPLRTKQMED